MYRIVLLSLPRQPQSTSITTPSITAVSAAILMHNISRTFYNPSNPYTPIHQILSNAASEIICSAELYFLSCTAGQENQLPPGFETMVERAYVITIIFTGTAAIVLAVVVLCICSEDRKMKGELKRMLRKYEGPNLFTPVDKKANLMLSVVRLPKIWEHRLQDIDSVHTVYCNKLLSIGPMQRRVFIVRGSIVLHRESKLFWYNMFVQTHN